MAKRSAVARLVDLLDPGRYAYEALKAALVKEKAGDGSRKRNLYGAVVRGLASGIEFDAYLTVASSQSTQLPILPILATEAAGSIVIRGYVEKVHPTVLSYAKKAETKIRHWFS